MAYLDSRELQERLDELEGMEAAYLESVGLSMEEAPLDEEEKAELEELRSLANEISEWQYGATLIPENDFTDYAQQLAEDIGAIDQSATWPLTCIDWEAAAEALKEDYAEVEYLGVTYLVRD